MYLFFRPLFFTLWLTIASQSNYRGFFTQISKLCKATNFLKSFVTSFLSVPQPKCTFGRGIKHNLRLPSYAIGQFVSQFQILSELVEAGAHCTTLCPKTRLPGRVGKKIGITKEKLGKFSGCKFSETTFLVWSEKKWWQSFFFKILLYQGGGSLRQFRCFSVSITVISFFPSLNFVVNTDSNVLRLVHLFVPWKS